MIALGLAVYMQSLCVGMGLPSAMITAAWVAVRCAQLVVVDIREHRLPDRLTLPMAAAVPALLICPSWQAAAAGASPGVSRSMLGAALGGSAMLAVYTVILVASRGSFGMGDVKLAASLGCVLGWLGPSAWIAGLLLPFVVAAGVGVMLVCLAGRPWSTRLAFGPYMVLGVVAAVPISGVGR